MSYRPYENTAQKASADSNNSKYSDGWCAQAARLPPHSVAMSVMTTFFWVSFLVLASIVGNILWLRPSARERALAAQRAFAKAQGLAVSLRAAPEWLAQKPGQGLVAQYRYALTKAPPAVGRWRWHEGLANWQPLDDKTAWLSAPPWPTPAPAGWLGLDVRRDAVVLYWREDGRIDSVERVIQLLKDVFA